MKELRASDWLDHARWYYSQIGEGAAEQPVSVFDANGRDEVSNESPGLPCLHPGALGVAFQRGCGCSMP